MELVRMTCQHAGEDHVLRDSCACGALEHLIR